MPLTSSECQEVSCPKTAHTWRQSLQAQTEILWRSIRPSMPRTRYQLFAREKPKQCVSEQAEMRNGRSDSHSARPDPVQTAIPTLFHKSFFNSPPTSDPGVNLFRFSVKVRRHHRLILHLVGISVPYDYPSQWRPASIPGVEIAKIAYVT